MKNLTPKYQPLSYEKVQSEPRHFSQTGYQFYVWISPIMFLFRICMPNGITHSLALSLRSLCPVPRIFKLDLLNDKSFFFCSKFMMRKVPIFLTWWFLSDSSMLDNYHFWHSNQSTSDTNIHMGILTKMSQLGHYETDGVHWERGSRVNTRELPSLTRFRRRGRSSR
jgi:hypothetical protein